MPVPLAPVDDRLIWIDLEMTGLKPETDRILEVAIVVTDHDLVTVAEAPVWVLHQDDATLAGMDAWNQSTHGRSGLTAKAKASMLTDAEVESAALAFMREHLPAKASPMCGNSICQDRRFLARWMPAFEDYFHYRNLDVSTLKELARRLSPTSSRASRRKGATRRSPTCTSRSPSFGTTARRSCRPSARRPRACAPA